MTDASRGTEGLDLAEALILELLRTAFSLSGSMASLLEDLPEEVFPGEDPGAVLIEMMAGSSLPVVEAVGETDCRAAMALIDAVRERILDDLRAAAQLARDDGEALL